MRPLFSALVFVHALAAVAQTTVSSEVLSDPLPYVSSERQLAAPAVAMAQDSRGVAIAWSMPNEQHLQRVYLARLNATGHVEGAVHAVPVLSTNGPVNALYPSLAADAAGGGFAIAWTELKLVPQHGNVTAYCHFDGSLQPGNPSVLVAVNDDTPPAIVRTGRSGTWITASQFVWQLQSDGSFHYPLDGGFPQVTWR